MGRRWKELVLQAASLVAAAVLPLAAVEVVLRAIDYRPSMDWYFQGFDDDSPIFRERDGSFEVVPDLRTTFRAESFAAERSPGEVRLVAVGDSVTWGHRANDADGPLDAWPDVLQRLLREKPGGAASRVVNCGARTYASGRIEGVFRQALDLRPDAVVASFGSSEFLEDATRRAWEVRRTSMPAWLRELRLAGWLEEHLRGASAVGGAGLSASELRARDAELVASFVDPALVAEEADRSGILDAAEERIDRMAASARARGVPVVLLTVPANLRWPPFASRWPAGEDGAAAREAVRQAGEQLDRGLPAEARARVEPLARRWPAVAALRYRLAQAFDALGVPERARDEYRAARDEDGFPLRAPGILNDHLRRVAARDPGVVLVDVERLFEASVPDGIPDDRLFLDQNHPTEAAHRRIAEAVLAALEGRGLAGASR